MNNLHPTHNGDVHALGEVAQLLSGLERQKEELGPIAEELLELFHRLGVAEQHPDEAGINPSNG